MLRSTEAFGGRLSGSWVSVGCLFYWMWMSTVWVSRSRVTDAGSPRRRFVRRAARPSTRRLFRRFLSVASCPSLPRPPRQPQVRFESKGGPGFDSRGIRFSNYLLLSMCINADQNPLTSVSASLPSAPRTRNPQAAQTRRARACRTRAPASRTRSLRRC